MSDAIKHITNDIFFSFFVHAKQSNCCGTLDFLSPEPCPPTAPSWAHWLQDLGTHTPARVVDQKEWKNAIFVLPRFARQCRSTSYLGLHSKASFVPRFKMHWMLKYPNAFTYVKVMANHRWDVFLRHSVVVREIKRSKTAICSKVN